MVSRDERLLDEWVRVRPFLWSLPGDGLTAQTTKDAVLGYLLRALSRGRVPPVQPMLDYLEGKTPLPSCGFIGCPMDTQCSDHVH